MRSLHIVLLLTLLIGCTQEPPPAPMVEVTVDTVVRDPYQPKSSFSQNGTQLQFFSSQEHHTTTSIVFSQSAHTSFALAIVVAASLIICSIVVSSHKGGAAIPQLAKRTR